MTAWYAISNARDIPSPTVLLYPDRIEANLRRMIELAGDVRRLRPHVKTHKLPPIIALKRAAGIDKFKVATIAEAEMVAQSGGGDILVAHQPNGPAIDRLVALMKKYPAVRWSAIVDDPEILKAISQAVSQAGLQLALYLDLNVGMNRTGIIPGPAAHALYGALCTAPGIVPGGLHAYDGHLRDSAEGTLAERVEKTFEPVWALRRALLAEGLAVPRVIASGTPTFALTARRNEAEIEVGAGTAVLWDQTEEEMCASHQLSSAAILMTRVISKPAPGLLCLDLGHKAVASEMPHPRVRLFGLEDAVAVGHSEEHLVLRTDRADDYQVGDVVYGVPRHVCPTMALHSEVWAVRGGQATEIWPVVARARRLTV